MIPLFVPLFVYEVGAGTDGAREPPAGGRADELPDALSGGTGAAEAVALAAGGVTEVCSMGAGATDAPDPTGGTDATGAGIGEASPQDLCITTTPPTAAIKPPTGATA